MSLKDTSDAILKVWADVPAAAASVRILESLAGLPDEELQMLTFRSLQRAAGGDLDPDELVVAINILVASRFSLLSSHALFVDDDQREFQLDDEEFAAAQETGVVIHPETGKEVLNAVRHLVPFFVPTDRFFKAVK